MGRLMRSDGVRIQPAHWIGAALAVVAVTLAAFWPVLDNGFVNWGDQAELVGNERFRGFSGEHLRWMFSTNLMGHYQPLSWLTLAIDHAFWGMNPRGFHLSTLVLHAACAVVAMVVIVQLIRASRLRGAASGGWMIVAAAVGALTFGVHPLRVEEVAWTVERRGVLSALFYLLSIGLYLEYIRKSRLAWQRRGRLGRLAEGESGAAWAYTTAVACFLLSLLAKEFGFLLPIVLLILDAYPLRRLRAARRGFVLRLMPLLLEKWPFFLIAFLGALIAIWSSMASNVAKDLSEYGVLQRLAQAFFGLSFYVEKTLWPSGLSPIYSIPPVLNPLEIQYLARAGFVIGLAAALWIFRRRVPGALAAWAAYVVIVSPVLGLTQTGRQLAADRYTYLPAVGLGAVVAAVVLRFRAQPGAVGRVGAPVVVVVLLAAVGGLALAANRQTRIWRDSETLWQHARAVNPRCPVAHNNLAVLRAESNRDDEAIRLFRYAIELDPRNFEAYRNLGAIYARRNQFDQALDEWRAALAINPNDAVSANYIRQAEAILNRR